MDTKKTNDVNLEGQSQAVTAPTPKTTRARTTAKTTATATKTSGETTKKTSPTSVKKTSAQTKSTTPRKTTAKLSQATAEETEKKAQSNSLMDNSVKKKTSAKKTEEKNQLQIATQTEKVEVDPPIKEETATTQSDVAEQPKKTRTRNKTQKKEAEVKEDVAVTDEQSSNIEIPVANHKTKNGEKSTNDKKIKDGEKADFINKSEEDKKTAKRQKILKTVLTIGFIALIVGILIYTFLNDFILTDKETAKIGDLAKIWAECWWFLPCAIFSLFLLYFFKAAKLSVMAKSITGRWHFKTCFCTANLGLYMNNVTPLAVGGQPFEIAYLSKHGIHGGVASSLPIATFFLNQLAFVLCATVALILYNTNAIGFPTELMMSSALNATTTLLSIIGIICCFAVPLVVLLFSMFPSWGSSIIHVAMKVGGKLRIVKDPKVKTYKTIKNISHNSRCMKRMLTNPWVAISTSLMSIGEQLAQASIAYFVLKFFGFSILKYDSVIVGVVGTGNGFTEWLMIVCYSFILSASISFVPTPGNSGASELSFYLMFTMAFELTASPMFGVAFPAMMVWRILSYYSIIVIGFFSNLYMKRKDKRLLALASALPPDDEKTT